MANLSRTFFIYWQEYSTEGIPLDEETTTRVEFRGGSLTPLSRFIPAILQNPLVIRNIQNDPRIRGLKLIVYKDQGISSGPSFLAFSIRIAASRLNAPPISSHISLPERVQDIILIQSALGNIY
ncbi:hypothetical protein DTO013E5_8362 [Penicillium roqueforti]|nr:hypothetical protein DTO013F2_8988 [Penicillium roqueforti]KAI2767118.1 hypothetical protein DTO012A8_7667 [Penicillium roqueforti]KAI3070030.1 hypothetical protein CBS147339_7543 [Penicillium roqueforti]KAI3090370.1 hypothetical protein CBS147338_9043 [Penicillium roqueforti]KAI3182491.1 hypothetical protein DTO032C6_7267 [Penicillium roqueforti]